jgi:hypothetical protein
MQKSTKHNRVSNGIENILTVLSSLIVVASPVCALWAMQASHVTDLFS